MWQQWLVQERVWRIEQSSCVILHSYPPQNRLLNNRRMKALKTHQDIPFQCRRWHWKVTRYHQRNAFLPQLPMTPDKWSGSNANSFLPFFFYYMERKGFLYFRPLFLSFLWNPLYLFRGSLLWFIPNYSWHLLNAAIFRFVAFCFRFLFFFLLSRSKVVLYLFLYSISSSSPSSSSSSQSPDLSKIFLLIPYLPFAIDYSFYFIILPTSNPIQRSFSMFSIPLTQPEPSSFEPFIGFRHFSLL